MSLTKSVLRNVKETLGLDPDTSHFDVELLLYINSAIVKLNQNGVGKNTIIEDESTKWLDIQDPDQAEGNKTFSMVPLYVNLSTKIIFDPPPPSMVDYYSKQMDELLWRLKVAYENGSSIVSTKEEE